MAKKRTTDAPNKSAFIRSVLAKSPKAKVADVNAAWTAAGNRSEIGTVLYYKVKGRSTRNGKRGQRMRAPDNGAAETSTADGYAIIEQKLDQLIAKADELNDRGLAEAIRTARRRASAKLL